MNASGYLQSFGWKEGEALQKGGLKKPILVKHKKDTKGLGHDHNKDGDVWWERLFDGQLKNLEVNNNNNNGSVSFESNNDKVVESVNRSMSPLYRMFVKGEGLAGTVGRTDFNTAKQMEVTPSQALREMEKLITNVRGDSDDQKKKKKKEEKAAKKKEKAAKKKEKAAKKEKVTKKDKAAKKKIKENTNEKKEKKENKVKKDKKEKTSYIIITFKPRRRQLPVLKQTRFKFTLPDKWQIELQSFETDQQELNGPITESSAISTTLDELIQLVLKEFVQPWYSHISSSTLFTDSITVEIKQVIHNIIQRTENIDYTKLLVSKLVPIIQDHFQASAQAETYVKNKGNFSKFDSPNFQLAVAQQYKRGKLHRAVTIASTQPLDINQKKYLRGKINACLPYILSENERDNEVSMSLVTEILSCTVLSNIINLITEADFYNLIIIKLIGDNLRRRDQVKQLRAALEEHTQLKRPLKEQLQPVDISITSLFNEVENAQDLVELTNVKDSVRKLPNSSSKLELTGLMNNKKEQLTLLTLRDSLSLRDILNNPTKLKLFKEFLKNPESLGLIDFWLAVEAIKSPLEEEHELSLSFEYTNISDIYEIYDKYIATGVIKLDNQDVFTELTISEGQDKVKSYHKARSVLFELQNDTYFNIENEYLPLFKTSDTFTKLLVYNDDISQPDAISPEIVHAVESAFSQIMSKQDDNIPDEQTLDSKRDIAPSIFGNDDDEEEEDEDRQVNNKLFDSDDESDGDSLNFDSDNQSTSLTDSEVQLAAPGNLNLAEEIRKLNNEIDNLHQQLSILEPLITKAELTNNLSELKVLQRSKSALIREINFKELQKQQYIVQENDNSLYGKSRVCIQSYISSNENNKEFILYIIEVQKFSNDDPNITTAGWVVARRFSQFYRLYEYLKLKYPSLVSNIKFPKRSILKFQQHQQLVDIRQRALENYLQQLIKIPEICSNKAFRSFLSSENFNLHKNQPFGDTNDNAEFLANKWYRGIYDKFMPISPTHDIPNPIETESQIVENIRDMEKELKQFDEGIGTKTTVFVKPICDLLITVFRLSNSKSWLRGRALVVILQQLFGTTIEKKVYQTESQFKSEESLLELILLLKEKLFPDGKFKDPPIIRTLYQQSNTRQEAKGLWSVFMSETCSTIFGTSNTTFASNTLFRMIQNDYLNKHLIFEIFDELFNEIFPEVAIN
ncbi:Sorting nexin-12 [Spathaspora sp. JA1]|nr:Sorting nexin-12 [Spathaspora sp. JA1]